MMWMIDFEVFKYDWLMVGLNPYTREEVVIINDKNKLEHFYRNNKNNVFVGWNIRDYDQYIFKAILLGFNPKDVNDFIIVDKCKGWQYSSLFHKIPMTIYDSMPSIPVSLKTMEGFLGKNIHETSVPFNINRKLTEEEINETVSYCRDDVLNLLEVFMLRMNEFDSQYSLVKEFKLPLSSLGKSQAQLAAVILDAKKHKFNDEWDIRLPENLQLGKYQKVGDWFLNKENHSYDKSLEIEIGGLPTTIAWGGLHSGLKKEIVECAEDEVILDADVAQLYPSIMIEYNLTSRAVADNSKLKEILDTSLRLKAEGKKKEREPYKRICNIVYGASGDPTNAMYDPLNRNLVCVFGQVLIIDLVDKLDGLVRFINKNTDGVFFVIKKKDIPEMKRRVSEWEKRTCLKMEYDEYIKMYCGDVNNYLAVKADGKYHGKGAYVKDLSPLDYDLPIVNEAIKNYLLNGVPPRYTATGCHELIKFQKIVKLSSKYDWVEHENGMSNSVYNNKAYRVFASNNLNNGRLLKCKTTEKGVKRDKFANTPDHCFICNDDIRGKDESGVDKQWYIDLANKRLKEKFGIEVV